MSRSGREIERVMGRDKLSKQFTKVNGYSVCVCMWGGIFYHTPETGIKVYLKLEEETSY